MNLKNQEISYKKQKKYTTLIAYLCMYISGFLQVSIGSYLGKYVLSSNEEMASNITINNTLIGVTFVAPLLQIITFIIEMVIFHWILTFILSEEKFKEKIPFRSFLNTAGIFSIIKGICVFLLSLIVLKFTNYMSLSVVQFTAKWSYASAWINRFAQLVFFLSLLYNFGKKVFKDTSKLKLSIAFMGPYMIICIISIIFNLFLK
ncbi:hypothetical protein [Clostridium kluyveri]|nr:hypothetical protein [Clostridium kluyveri]